MLGHSTPTLAMEKHMNSLLQSLQHDETMLLILIVPLIFLFLLSRFRRHKPHPPGPKGLPLMGNIMMINHLSPLGLSKLAKEYGGFFRLKMGFVNMVAVSSPEIARQIFQVHDHIFSSRPATIAKRFLSYDRADMVYAEYGPFWRQMRKLCVMKLFSRRRTESWNSVRDEVDEIIRIVDSRVGSNVNLGELVFRLTRNITYRAAFGSSCREGQDEFIQIMQEFSKLFGTFNLADFFPWVKWLDLQGINKRLVKARASLDKFIDSIIDDHMEKKKNMNIGSIDLVNNTDMVDELLVFYSDHGTKVLEESDDLQKSMRLTRDNIKAMIMDVMFGGTETVASVIEWTMAELMRNPEDLKKVQEELADVVGLHRKVDESDLDKLPYYKCCLKEVLRLHPPIPLIIHQAAGDSEVAGYYIPAKTRVVVNAWAIGRDRDSWEDAEKFKPSRFLKDGAPDYKGNDFEFIPFGSGRRSCPGMQLGLFALEMAVAHLLHCFRWELPEGMKHSDLDMDDVLGLTAPRANRLMAVPTPRLICPLY